MKQVNTVLNISGLAMEKVVLNLIYGLKSIGDAKLCVKVIPVLNGRDLELKSEYKGSACFEGTRS